ncbi:HlyC/CorC family transporter, partial [Candidatus Sumerlaeota bacterium]|nr:HlyC/CorC family transporter [Candidatus Sumerlaeota bacterium]
LAFRTRTQTTILVARYIANMAFVAYVLIVVSRAMPGRAVVWVPIGLLISAIAVAVFGELAPRAVGRCFNNALAPAFAPMLVGLTQLLAPARWAVLTAAGAILGQSGLWATERETESEAGFDGSVAAAPTTGRLEQEEREMVSGVVEFGSTRAGEIMTPRTDIVAFGDDTPHEELLREMCACKLSRVLIHHESLDHVRGVLHVKDVLLNPQTDYREMLRKPLIVPEGKGLMDLLREFRRHRVHLAVVCDEFGQTAGVVTMQDLLEEIVGGIGEESGATPSDVRRIGPFAWSVPGQTNLAALREQVGLDLPTESGRTVAGFVATRLGRIPQVGDSTIEGEYRLTVERTVGRRVALMRVESIVPTIPEGSEDGHL